MSASQFDPLFPDSLEVLLQSRQDEPVTPSLVLHPTEQCNARCAHCIVMAGPERRTRLESDLALAAIQGAARIDNLGLVTFSGGETFLDLEQVLTLCRAAKDEHLRTRVVTNGFWATSPTEAAAMLGHLAAGGVDQLVVSFDEYHIPWVDVDRVRNVFLGARQATELPYLLFSAVIGPAQGRDEIVSAENGVPWPHAVLALLERYGFAPAECVPRELVRAQAGRLDARAQQEFRQSVIRNRALIHWNPMTPSGRASCEIDEEFPRWPAASRRWSECAVAGLQVTVPTSGRVYPCCSVWSGFENHDFGEVQNADQFAALVIAMLEDPVPRALRERGPVDLALALLHHGHQLPDSYSDICQACEAMLEAVSLDTIRAVAADLLQKPGPMT